MKRRQYEWWIIGILGLVAFALGVAGYAELFAKAGIERTWLDLTFQSLKLFTAEFLGEYDSPIPWRLEIARWLAPAVFLSALVKTVLYFIRREFKSLLLRFYQRHVIVSSVNERSRFLIEDLLKKGRKVIVVLDAEHSGKEDLLEKQGAVIQVGSITDPKFLKKIAAHKAEYFIFLEQKDEVNISNALFLYAWLDKFKHRKRQKKQTIFTHVADDIKLSELIELDFFKGITINQESNVLCEVRFFSMYERTARVLFNDYPPELFVPVRPESPQVNVAIIGSGPLAQSMVLRLARLGHYANFRKVKVSLFHEGSATVSKLFQNFHSLDKIIDLEAIGQSLELFDIRVFDGLHRNNPVSVVYLLCEDDSVSSNILKKLTHSESDDQLNVVMTLTDPASILNKWYPATQIGPVNLSKFNAIEETFTLDGLISEQLDGLAKIVHQDYLDSFEILDPKKGTHKKWEFLSVNDQNQNREQADHLFVKLRAIDAEAVYQKFNKKEAFLYDQDADLVERLAKMEHNRWLAHKLLAGWTYGKTEDQRRKRHPDIIDYEKLDEDIKDYDRRPVRNMKKLLEKGGMVIVKKGE